MKDTCNSDSISTNESKQNSYTSKKVLARNPQGHRIDHIFVRSSDNIKTTILEYKLPLPDRVPGQKFSYSDHEAVQVRLRLQTKQEGDTCSIRHINACIDGEDADFENEGSMRDVRLTPPQTPIIANGNGRSVMAAEGECPVDDEPRLPKSLAVIKESIELCDEHLKKLKTDRIIYFSIAGVLLVALIVMAEFPVPVGYKTLYLLLKLLVFAIILFCTFMGSIWNLMERNGTLSGKTSMEIKLQTSQYLNLKRD